MKKIIIALIFAVMGNQAQAMQPRIQRHGQSPSQLILGINASSSVETPEHRELMKWLKARELEIRRQAAIDVYRIRLYGQLPKPIASSEPNAQWIANSRKERLF